MDRVPGRAAPLLGTPLEPFAGANAERQRDDTGAEDKTLLNVVIMTVGFCLLFMAFFPLQAYVSSILPGPCLSLRLSLCCQ